MSHLMRALERNEALQLGAIAALFGAIVADLAYFVVVLMP